MLRRTDWQIINGFWEDRKALIFRLGLRGPLKEALKSFETSVLTSLHGVTSQKTSSAQLLLLLIVASEL
jgi:hypothetical protein